MGTGSLIKKISDDRYLLLTAAHNFKVQKTEGSFHVSEVEFYLQRNGVTKMAAKFIVDIDTIKFFTGY